MVKSINILDKEYLKWVEELAKRYRSSQIKASIKINTEQLKYNWMLGRDIVEMKVEQRWGESVIVQLSKDLRKALPNVQGLSKSNIYYCRKFYLLYNPHNNFFQQLAGKMDEEAFFQQVVGIFDIPWGHHCNIIDKVKGDVQKALFYVRQTVENGWSRPVLQTFLDSDLYNRQGKAITNFTNTLPQPNSELAQELTKDPYNFAFAGITKPYNEQLIKDALLNKVTSFLIELGTGFAYVGKEYRLQIGETENFIDLLFYNLRLRCYVVIEVKITKFESRDIGQIGTYVTAVNHLLRKEGIDNPTIGLLICRSKDNTLAQYALESCTQPIGISEYELEKFYPEKIEGTMPTIEEIEAKLNDNSNK